MDGGPMVGAYGGARSLTADEQAMVDGLKSRIQSEANDTFTKFNPVAIVSQVVAGTNYKVKIEVGDNEYIHVLIYKPLPYTGKPAKVESVFGGKTQSDPL